MGLTRWARGARQEAEPHRDGISDVDGRSDAERCGEEKRLVVSSRSAMTVGHLLRSDFESWQRIDDVEGG